LIDNNNVPQLCDFGLISIYFEEGSTGMTTTSAYTGTDRYLAYELLLDADTALPTTASDIFALACVGLEVVSFLHPLWPDLCLVAVPDLLFTTAVRPSQK
jgi:serine/threonine protein kinase